MQHALRLIVNDARKGKNIDSYLIIIVAFITLGLSVWGFTSTDQVLNVILAVLATLSFSHLINRWSHQEQSVRTTSLCNSGIVDFHSQLDEKILNMNFAEATNEIRILQTWLPGETSLPEGLYKSACRGIPIRILLIDPTSEVAKLRTQNLGRKSDWIESKLSQLKNEITNELRMLNGTEKQSNITVKLYNQMPPFCLYAADNLLAIGWYWAQTPNVKGPHLVIKDRGSVLGKEIIRTFDKLWVDGSPFNHYL